MSHIKRALDASELHEVVDRCRRMETRLTRFLETQGFDTGVQRAVWRPDTNTVDIPTPALAFKEILAVIPGDWPPSRHVFVLHKGEWLATVLLPTTVSAV